MRSLSLSTLDTLCKRARTYTQASDLSSCGFNRAFLGLARVESFAGVRGPPFFFVSRARPALFALAQEVVELGGAPRRTAAAAAAMYAMVQRLLDWLRR